MTHSARVITLTTATMVVALLCAGARSAGPSSNLEATSISGMKQKPPITHLYMHFLLHQAHLRALASGGADPRPDRLADYTRRKIGLTPQQWESVETSSLRMQTAVHSADDEAQKLAAADREAYRSGAVQPNAPPPHLTERRQLEARREKAMATEVSQLESELGAESTNALRAYLQNITANTIRTITPAQLAAMRKVAHPVQSGAAQ